MAAGVAVVATVLSPQPTATDNLNGYYWSEAQNQAAQEKAKQRYCATYPTDLVCAGKNPVYYQVNYQYSAPFFGCNPVAKMAESRQLLGPINSIDWYLNFVSYTRVANLYINFGNNLNAFIAGQSGVPCPNPSLFTAQINSVVRLDGKADVGGSKDWQDWPQAKRDKAVGLLTPSDWSEFTKSMPEGGRLNPGDQLEAPVIVLPGLDTDDPNTPADERLPQVFPGPWTIPTPYLIPSPSPSPDPEPSPSPDPSPAPSPEPTPTPPVASTDPPPDAPPPDEPSDPPDGSDSEDNQTTTDDMWGDLDEINNPTPEISDAAQKIANGHAFDKHRTDFLEIESRTEFAQFIDNIMNKPTEKKSLDDDRTGYWDENSGTVVVEDPNDEVDGGTAFKPEKGKSYFDNELK